MSTRVQYGNFRSPTQQGLMGMSLTATAAGLAGIFVCLMVLVLAGLKAGFVAFVVASVIFVPLALPPVQGRTLYARWSHVMKFKRAERQGKTVYLAGPAGRSADGNFRLPGMLASSRVEEVAGPYNEDMGVIVLPNAGHYTVVLEVHATGNELVDQGTIDGQVAAWGGWLSHLSTESRVIGASVTVETARDTGVRLSNAVRTAMDGVTSPEFSQTVVGEILDQAGAGTAPSISTRVAITYCAKPIPQQAESTISRYEMIEEIRTTLPAMMDGLRSTGAGHNIRVCTPADIIDATRVAYDPSVALMVEQQRRVSGGTGLTWEDAGPSYHRHYWDYYQHDRAYSVSWMMGSGPSGNIYDTALQRLMAPDSRIDRKRVTMLYRAIPASRSAALAQTMQNNAAFVAQQSTNRTKARVKNMVVTSQKTAEEEAMGATFLRFGLVVTATVTDESRLPAVRQIITTSATPTKLRLREALGNQDTAFVAGLPLGVVLPKHVSIW